MILGDYVKSIAAPYFIAAVSALIAVAFFYGYFKGKSSVQEEFDAYRAEVISAQAQVRADNERKISEANRVTVDTANGYASAIDYLRKHPVIRVLPAHCDSGTGPAVPSTASRPDETAAQQGLGSVEIAAAECQERLTNAAEDAMTLLWLQDWIRKQTQVK